jgi:hypothetical protein
VVTRRRWTLELVVADLQRLAASGEAMTRAALLSSGHTEVISAAERYAGSFAKAVRLAGLEVVPARASWTAARVVEEIRRLHAQGVALSCEQLTHSGHAGLVTAAKKLLGNWRSAIAAAGVPRYVRGPWKSWDLIAAKLRELAAAGVPMTGSALEERELASLFSAAVAAAGTWNTALVKAGLEPTEVHERWTREAVLDGMRRLHADGIVSFNEAIARGEQKLVRATERYFGSWQEAFRAAVPGYQPLLRSWTVDDVVEGIRERHARGLPVRATEVFRDDTPLFDAARRVGIPWREACRRAGVPAVDYAVRKPATRTRWTDEMLLEKLRDAAARGVPLITKSFTGGFVGAVYGHFGSWGKAMAAAGLFARHVADREAAKARRLDGRGLPRVRGGRKRRGSAARASKGA